MGRRFEKVHAECEVYCEDSVRELLYANTFHANIEVLLGLILKEGWRFVIDPSFPELMAVSMRVIGHKGPTAIQRLALSASDDVTYIVAGIDLSKEDGVRSLDDLDPEQLAALRLAAGYTTA